MLLFVELLRVCLKKMHFVTRIPQLCYLYDVLFVSLPETSVKNSQDSADTNSCNVKYVGCFK